MDKILGKVLGNRVVLVGAAILVGGYLLFGHLRPVIQQVPVVPFGENILVVQGENFGSRQGNSRLLLNGEPLPVQLWNETEIVALLPEPPQNGTVQVIRRTPVALRTAVVPFLVQAETAPEFAIPVQADAPWPLFRRDHLNTGNSPLIADYAGDEPWAFTTGGAILATPVIDAAGTIYVGSGDHYFYAIEADGTLRWSFQTGAAIEAAAALLFEEPESGVTAVIAPSTDGLLTKLDTNDGTIIWQFDAGQMGDQAANGWQGAVGIGHDGAIYAGNQNFHDYAINPDGTLRWVYETAANNRSLAAFGADGTVYWESDDGLIGAIDPAGGEKWTATIPGSLSATPAIGSDNTLYITSSDNHLTALDAMTGDVHWKFKTAAPVLGSAALAADEAGETTMIVVAAANGRIYALSPTSELLWMAETGEPIHSSPVIGQSETGAIVYVVAGDGRPNGRLYALNLADGTLRWSFDTTLPGDLVLRNQTPSSGSPALGETGIYIGSEQGALWYVPYDYCLFAGGSSEQAEVDSFAARCKIE